MPLAATIRSLEEAQGALAQNDARLLELEATATVAAEALASARADCAIEAEHTAATALERELQVILTSRSWRLTAPLRRFRRALQHGTFIASIRGG